MRNKTIFSLMLFLFSIYLSSCQKSEKNNLNEESLEFLSTQQSVYGKKMRELTTDDYNKSPLPKEHYLLKQFETSKKLLSLPTYISTKIKDITPYLISSKDEKIKAIIFDLENNSDKYRYKSLVVYSRNGKFLPILIQNEKLNDGYSRISFNSPNNEEYMSFYVNKEDKVGKFSILKDIPFIEINKSEAASTSISTKSNIQCGLNQYYSECGPTTPLTYYNYENPPIQIGCAVGCFCNNGYVIGPSGYCIRIEELGGNPIPQSACVRKTNSFSECMKCTIDECNSDWVCYIGCGVHFAGCMSLFAAVCSFA